jgi:hypothetical protein
VLFSKEFKRNTLSSDVMRKIAPHGDPVDVEAQNLNPTTSVNATLNYANIISKNKLPKDASETSQKRKYSEASDEDKENQGNGNKKKSTKKGKKNFYTHSFLAGL